MKHIIFTAILTTFLTACASDSTDQQNLKLSAKATNGTVVLSYASSASIMSIKQEAGGDEYPYNIFAVFYDKGGKFLGQNSNFEIGLSEYESVRFDSIKKSKSDEFYFSHSVLIEWINKTDPPQVPARGFIRLKMGANGPYFPLICKYEKEGEYINSLNCKNTTKMF